MSEAQLGQARKKTVDFLTAHPFCCFCGGLVPATTVDHVPSRACFHGKVGPEGYEFPACNSCQTRLRQEEQFFAFMCHLSDRNNENYDSKMSPRLMQGIRNNLPELYPSITKSANAKRRGLRHFGIEKPAGMTLNEVPMVEFPLEIDGALRKVITKIGLALYYKHKAKSATTSHHVASFWAQSADRVSMKRFGQIVEELSAFQRGSRKNLDFGDRFSYAWGVEEQGEPDIFVVIVKFGQGLVVCSLITEANVVVRDEDPRMWLAVSDFGAGSFPESWEKLV